MIRSCYLKLHPIKLLQHSRKAACEHELLANCREFMVRMQENLQRLGGAVRWLSNLSDIKGFSIIPYFPRSWNITVKLQFALRLQICWQDDVTCLRFRKTTKSIKRYLKFHPITPTYVRTPTVGNLWRLRIQIRELLLEEFGNWAGGDCTPACCDTWIRRNPITRWVIPAPR